MNKEENDIVASIEILRANIEMFHRGKRELYRVIAVELRKLLCDGQQSLLPRVVPELQLHPVIENPAVLPRGFQGKLVFEIPSTMNFDGKGGSRVEAIFDESKQSIKLDAWLNQMLFTEKITIREFIRSVSDKESVHSDPDYNDTLKFSKSVKIAGEDLHKQHIIAIGEYILKNLDKRFRN